MRREMLRWVGFTAGSAFVAGALLAPAADAAVVICKRKNKIQLRETACKSKETQIAAAELAKISGKIQMKPMVLAASTVRTDSPIVAPIQLIA